jgi:drug/metabolite transporter (DMT)-like permease
LFYLFFLIFELLPVIFYVSFLRRNRHEGLQVIFIYCLISLGTELFSSILGKAFGISIFYFFASFTILEYSLLTLFLYRQIQDRRQKYVLIIGSLAFFAIAVTNFLHGKTSNFDSLSASVEAILIIIYSLIFLYGQIKDPSVLFVYNTKKFWVVSAFFIYFSSTLFLFLYAATFTKEEHKNWWYINNLFDIIKNILFCIAFAMKKSDKRKSPIEESYEDSYGIEF